MTVATRRERRRQRHLEDARLADVIVLSFLTRLYARYGTDEQLERMIEVWHDRERWAHRERLRR